MNIDQRDIVINMFRTGELHVCVIRHEPTGIKVEAKTRKEAMRKLAVLLGEETKGE